LHLKKERKRFALKITLSRLQGSAIKKDSSFFDENKRIIAKTLCHNVPDFVRRRYRYLSPGVGIPKRE